MAQSPLPSGPEALLADLKGLHLPDDPSFWPPAPGWWGVVLLLCALLLVVVKKIARGRQQRETGWRDSALRHHEEIAVELHSGAPLNQVLSRSSVLMRKVALASLPRQSAAAVQQDDWLQLLDELGQTQEFSNGAGRLLLSHPYQRQSDIKREQVVDLLALMHNTIRVAAGEAPRV